MSKEKDLIEKNIELSTEFSRYLFDHPEIQKNTNIQNLKDKYYER